MKIKNHLLFNDDDSQVSFKLTPNRRGEYVPQYLIMHYTAATTAESAISWFQSPIAEASAHLVIARDGFVTQFAPFNIVTWHAGESKWRGLVGLNKFSIGIELVNGGRLQKSGGRWVCSVDKRNISDSDVLIATHKNDLKEAGWHEYTEKQMEVAVEIAALLVRTYNLKDVLGHEDISPIRKSDPGPAFAMGSFRTKAMGRQDENLDKFKTATELNIRMGAGSNFQTLTDKPLPPETRVLVLKTEGNWSFVEVLDTVHGVMDLEGWVSSKFLTHV